MKLALLVFASVLFTLMPISKGCHSAEDEGDRELRRRMRNITAAGLPGFIRTLLFDHDLPTNVVDCVVQNIDTIEGLNATTLTPAVMAALEGAIPFAATHRALCSFSPDICLNVLSCSFELGFDLTELPASSASTDLSNNSTQTGNTNMPNVAPSMTNTNEDNSNIHGVIMKAVLQSISRGNTVKEAIVQLLDAVFDLVKLFVVTVL